MIISEKLLTDVYLFKLYCNSKKINCSFEYNEFNDGVEFCLVFSHYYIEYDNDFQEFILVKTTTRYGYPIEPDTVDEEIMGSNKDIVPLFREFVIQNSTDEFDNFISTNYECLQFMSENV